MRQAAELVESVDLPMFGNLFHKAAELLYGSLKGLPQAPVRIRELLNSPAVDRAVEQAIRTEYFRDDPHLDPEAFGGHISLIGDIVRTYLNGYLLEYDSRNGDFSVEQVEFRDVSTLIAIPAAGVPRNVRLGGIIDRLDRLNEQTLRVVDYKTGQQKSEFRGIEGLLSPVHAHRNPAALQTLFYGWMLHRNSGQEVVPALYFIRSMNQPEYSPHLTEVETDENDRKKAVRAVLRISDYAPALEKRITETLTQLFDPDLPFTPCDDLKTCSYCPYRAI
ncbi:MAG: PD-(D/E)XK nuclease family protein, partial [Rikenellaceae bacterium]|nr:PD-(D/E)XK nuclease family protein [Rikenellaceae bacterium]